MRRRHVSHSVIETLGMMKAEIGSAEIVVGMLDGVGCGHSFEGSHIAIVLSAHGILGGLCLTCISIALRRWYVL